MATNGYKWWKMSKVVYKWIQDITNGRKLLQIATSFEISNRVGKIWGNSAKWEKW